MKNGFISKVMLFMVMIFLMAMTFIVVTDSNDGRREIVDEDGGTEVFSLF